MNRRSVLSFLGLAPIAAASAGASATAVDGRMLFARATTWKGILAAEWAPGELRASERFVPLDPRRHILLGEARVPAFEASIPDAVLDAIMSEPES